MMVLICIKQHLINIRSSIYEKLSNTEAELKKSVVYKKPWPRSWMGFNCFKVMDPLRRENLLFTTQFSGIPGTH